MSKAPPGYNAKKLLQFQWNSCSQMPLVLLINVLCALLEGNHRCWGKRGPIISGFITNCVWWSKFAPATGLSSAFFFFSHETCRNCRIAFLLNMSLPPAFTEVFALELMYQREILSAVLPGQKTSVVAERDRQKSLSLPYKVFTPFKGIFIILLTCSNIWPIWELYFQPKLFNTLILIAIMRFK